MEIRNYIKILKILCDPARLRLIKLLSSRELCVCEIEEVTGLKQPTVSQQLKRLREVDLVTERNEGKWCYYTLNTKILKDLLASLNDFIDIDIEKIEEFKSDCEKLASLPQNVRVMKCKCRE